MQKKTEIFNFIVSRRITNTVQYMKKRYDLNRSDSVKVCGLTSCNDDKQEYMANVTSKIEQLKRNLQKWSHRALSFNGRMISKNFWCVTNCLCTAILCNEPERLEINRESYLCICKWTFQCKWA